MLPSLNDARSLRLRLSQQGFREGENLQYYEDAHGGHDEDSWAKRLPRILYALFRDQLPAA